jgi:protein-disulfide isomerase
MITQLKFPISQTDHHRGSLMAPIKFVEYGDFECSYCSLALPQIEQFIKMLPGEICFAYRHFPLTDLHPHAELAAMASEAADQQDRFWDMFRALFDNQDSLSSQTVFQIAEELDLDMSRFRSDIESPQLMSRVERDFLGGIRSGINGTPGIFINDVLYEHPVQVENLVAAAQSILGHSSESHFPDF